MVDRREVAEVLRESLGDRVPQEALEAAATRIASLGEEWREVELAGEQPGMGYSALYENLCMVGELLHRGVPVRLFVAKRRPASAVASLAPPPGARRRNGMRTRELARAALGGARLFRG